MQLVRPFLSSLTRQRGNVLYLLIAAVVVAAVLIFWKESGRAAAKAERQRIELVQRQEAESAERAREAAAQRERVALEEANRKAQQDERDVLIQALRRFDDVATRWDDANKVASSAARIALAQPVGVLQTLHREATQLQAPPCLALGKDDLVVAMRETVDGYIAFMRNTAKLGNEFAQIHFAAAAPRFVKYKEVRATCPVP